MSIFDKDLFGKTKHEKALEMLREFEPEEGYYLAFSGGKDSIVIKELAKQSGVKFDSHYSITTVDPPELTRFIKEHHADVERHAPDMNMWDLIAKKKMPPTRIVRYCCAELKEEGGNGRFVITGVRWAESARRKNTRKSVEFDTYGSQAKKAKANREKFNLMNDNDEKRRMLENCIVKGKHILNPIVNWEDYEVWEFINHFKIPYCKLYDEGFKRLGCIGCPNSGTVGMERDFKKWPHVRKLYVRAFEKMIIERKKAGLKCDWKTGEDVMRWWLYGTNKQKEDIAQETLF